MVPIESRHNTKANPAAMDSRSEAAALRQTLRGSVEHAGETRRVATRADIGALSRPRRADHRKRRMGEEIPAMGVEVIELLEDGKLHGLGIQPAQGFFVADRIRHCSPLVHMTLRGRIAE